MSASFTGTNKSVSVSGASHNHGGDTGYTQPTFTGTAVTSGANNRGHTHSVGAHSHPINSGNTSTSGTETTVGFRGVSVDVTITDPGHTHTVQNIYNLRSNAGGDGSQHYFDHRSGASSGSADLTTNTTGITAKVTAKGYLYGKTDNSTAFNSGDESQNHTHSVTANGTVQNHRHTISSSGTLSMSGDYTPAGSVTIGAGDSETRPDNYSYVIWKRIA